jgi:formylglycine-generating enzyme required for sulfatase activity
MQVPHDDSNPDSNDPMNARPRESLRRIIAEVLSGRAHGQATSDSDVLAQHPELVDDLKPELLLADRIRQARLAAERAGPVQEKLTPLTDSDFDSLLTQSHGEQTEAPALPHLPGYFVQEEISHGGQAVVYRAKQESTGRTVAIKVMNGGPFVNSRNRTRFEREAKILGTLDHPYIVSILDRGRTPDGSFYFIMQYIDGMALDEYWKNEIQADSAGTMKLVWLFAQIAGAVHVAHSQGVIHRDLKPTNIRIDSRGDPHVLDFGLARPLEGHDIAMASSITMAGQIIGSLPWASPEQAAGQAAELDQRSDVYSTGVMLFQALTGEFPCSLQGPIDQVIRRIRTVAAEPPSRQAGARPGVNRGLDSIVLKALDKQPEDRYATMGALADDLNAWLAGKPLSANLERKPRPAKLAYLGVVMACIAIVLAAAKWHGSNSGDTLRIQLPGIQNSIGMTLVRIPHGAFDMGSPESEAGHDRIETRKRVEITHDFFIASTEVTQEQYEKVTGQKPSLQWQGAALPVENVSWDDAVKFCQQLSEREHVSYRLPTEMEWEYACRAGQPRAFQDPDRPDSTVWHSNDSGGATHAVAMKLPNAWGLFDMQGNVAEWCDRSEADQTNTGSSDKVKEMVHCCRGGSALTPLTGTRAAARRFIAGPFPDVGFRVVRDP